MKYPDVFIFDTFEDFVWNLFFWKVFFVFENNQFDSNRQFMKHNGIRKIIETFLQSRSKVLFILFFEQKIIIVQCIGKGSISKEFSIFTAIVLVYSIFVVRSVGILIGFHDRMHITFKERFSIYGSELTLPFVYFITFNRQNISSI